jgi:hypothetical protein
MNAKVRNYLRGAGSVVDVIPAWDFSQFVPKKTPAERMTGHFARIAAAIGNACNTFENDGKTSRNKAKAA